ncbi:MAG: hypothetical protein RJA70_3567 [Pseudomonadota bacterium]|jgi:uncharacterized protein (TIRG00374 family)
MKLELRKILWAMLFGVGLYGGFVVFAGYQQIAASLTDFRWWTLGAALALSSFNYLLRFLKWQYYLRLLRIDGVRPLDSLLIFLSGFVLTVTPGKLGEVFKSAVLAQTHGVPPERSAPIVIAERLTDVIAIVALILLGSLTLPGGLVWALFGAAAVGTGLVAIFWETPTLWLFTRLERGLLAPMVLRLREAYRRLQALASPSALLWPSALSLVGWASEGFALYLLLLGFHAEVPILHAVFFYATATLAGALIPVPGGLGVTETLIQQQLTRVATVTHAAATSSMLLIRLATLWWAVLVGFIALFWLRLRFPSLLRSSKASELPG